MSYIALPSRSCLPFSNHFALTKNSSFKVGDVFYKENNALCSIAYYPLLVPTDPSTRENRSIKSDRPR